MKIANRLIAISALLLSLSVMAAGDHVAGHETDAIGQPGVASRVTRTLHIDMTDAMRFSAANVKVKQGETIRFVLKNTGTVKHEMVLGTGKELKAHDEAMKKFPEMEHADANMASVAPGKTGEIIWHFTRAGTVDFACLQPGHYDAGMRGAVTVAGTKTSSPADRHSGDGNRADHGDHKH